MFVTFFLSLLFFLFTGCLDFSTKPVEPKDIFEEHPELEDLVSEDFEPEYDFEGEDYYEIDEKEETHGDISGEDGIICSCEGKSCGDDGCGNSCGTCNSPFYCSSDNRCVCVPRCDRVPCGGPDGCGDICRCILDGSFVSPQLWGSNRESFRNALSEMRAFGMSTIVLTAARMVSCDSSGSCNTSIVIDDDMLGTVLDDISDYGMKAMIGLVDCVPSASNMMWWENSDLINSCLSETESLLIEIELRYSSHIALSGFFIPPKVMAGIPVDNQNLGMVNDFYWRATQMIHNLWGDIFPSAGMVYFIASNNETPEAIQPSELGLWLREFIMGGTVQSSGLDIVILEDGVGEYNNSLWSDPGIELYVQEAYRAIIPYPLYTAIDLYQWSSTKTLSATDNYMHPASMSRIRRQIEATQEANMRIANQFPLHMASNAFFVPYSDESASLGRAYNALYFRNSWVEYAYYSFSSPCSSTYPDIGGVMLFDDRTGEKERTQDWVGWIVSPGSVLSIIVDLGLRKMITDVAVIMRSETSFNNYYPSRLRVYVSPDGSDTSYMLMGNIDIPYNSDSTYGNLKVGVSSPGGMDAQKVRLELVSRSQWQFLSEIEIY